MKFVKDNGNVMMVLKEADAISGQLISCNSVDASFEKHIPQYNKIGDKIEIFVNHVMEEDHYIEWIMVDYGKMQIMKHFLPGEEPKMTVDYKGGMRAYSYCNKHGLWQSENIH